MRDGTGRQRQHAQTKEDASQERDIRGFCSAHSTRLPVPGVVVEGKLRKARSIIRLHGGRVR
jgi:hypothetical protein